MSLASQVIELVDLARLLLIYSCFQDTVEILEYHLER